MPGHRVSTVRAQPRVRGHRKFRTCQCAPEVARLYGDLDALITARTKTGPSSRSHGLWQHPDPLHPLPDDLRLPAVTMNFDGKRFMETPAAVAAAEMSGLRDPWPPGNAGLTTKTLGQAREPLRLARASEASTRSVAATKLRVRDELRDNLAATGRTDQDASGLLPGVIMGSRPPTHTADTEEVARPQFRSQLPPSAGGRALTSSRVTAAPVAWDRTRGWLLTRGGGITMMDRKPEIRG